jgi:hypothetical protein
MVSRTLLRLLKEAVAPALLIVGAKVLSALALVYWFGLGWRLDSGFYLPRLAMENLELLRFVNSYSNLFLYGVVLLGFSAVLAHAYHFHDTHVSPAFVLRLMSWNLSKLLTTSEEIYHRGLVWVSYLWLVTLLVLLQVFVGTAYWWVGLFVTAFTLLVSWLFIADVERELVKK